MVACGADWGGAQSLVQLLWGLQAVQVDEESSWRVLNTILKLISKATRKLKKRCMQSSRSGQGVQALESFIFFFLGWLLQPQGRCCVIAWLFFF